MQTEVTEVVAKDLRRPLTLIFAIVSVIGVAVMGLRGVESMIDGRIELRLAAEKQKSEDYGKRIEVLEKQVSELREMLQEIRADVRYLRNVTEGRVRTIDSAREHP
jgi:hypothetical protein